MAEAGWYPDAQDPHAQHYFDGQNWTGHRRPNPDDDVAVAPVEQTVRRGDMGAASAPSAPSAPSTEETVRRGDLPGFAQPGQPGQPGQPWSAQPAPQWPADQQQPPAQWNQPGQQPQPWPYGPQGPGEWASPPAAPRPRRRKPLIIAGIAVVAVVAGLVTWLVLPGDDSPTITYDGKEVASASATLTSAEKALTTAIRTRRGASDDSTRCYFARPGQPAAGAKKTDVENSLRCGPVLYVDGQKSDAYLKVPLTDRASGSKVTLTAPDDVSDIEPSALGSDVDLVRPDGKSAPDGVGDLTVPQPPAAAKDVLTTAPIPDTSALTSVNAVMAAKYAKVTLTRAGQVSRYGTGADARSAPSGQKLLAFQLEYGTGDVDGSNDDAATLVVDGGTGRDIPRASGGSYVVAAVPTSSSATIVLTDGGFTQTLALPSGAAGATNIQVLKRTNRSGYVGTTVNVPIELSRGSQRASATFRATATVASLDFWAPGNTAVHPTNPRNAILTVRLNYTDSEDPGKTFGFDPALVRLRVGSVYLKARNIAGAGKILNVFEVNGNFTTGEIQVVGSVKVDNITVRVKTAKAFPVTIR